MNYYVFTNEAGFMPDHNDGFEAETLADVWEYFAEELPRVVQDFEERERGSAEQCRDMWRAVDRLQAVTPCTGEFMVGHICYNVEAC